MSTTHIVTGATGYTGKYMTRRLLDAGCEVRSLTWHLDRPSEFGDRVKMMPYEFDDVDALARSLEGADTLFNTYWIRVAYKERTHERTVGTSADAVRGSQVCRGPSGGPRQHHERDGGFSAAVFPGQGASRECSTGFGSVLRYAEADGHLRAWRIFC